MNSLPTLLVFVGVLFPALALGQVEPSSQVRALYADLLGAFEAKDNAAAKRAVAQLHEALPEYRSLLLESVVGNDAKERSVALRMARRLPGEAPRFPEAKHHWTALLEVLSDPKEPSADRSTVALLLAELDGEDQELIAVLGGTLSEKTEANSMLVAELALTRGCRGAALPLLKGLVAGEDSEARWNAGTILFRLSYYKPDGTRSSRFHPTHVDLLVSVYRKALVGTNAARRVEALERYARNSMYRYDDSLMDVIAELKDEGSELAKTASAIEENWRRWKSAR